MLYRVSVETIQEELMEWQKEIDELKEMMSPSSDVGLPLDFIAQLQEFVTVSHRDRVTHSYASTSLLLSL